MMMEKEVVSMEMIMAKDIVSMKKLMDNSSFSEDFPIPKEFVSDNNYTRLLLIILGAI